MSVYRRIIAYFRPFLGETLFALALTLLAIAAGLLRPWPVKFLIDGVLSAPGPGAAGETRALLARFVPELGVPALLAVLCGGMVLIHLLSGVLDLARNLLFMRVGLKALLRLRTELYSYLQSLPLMFHDSRRSADSSFRVAYDSQSVQTIYNKGFAGVFGSMVTLVGAFAIMVRMDWQLTLISLGILPFLAWTIRHYAARIRQQSTEIQERESSVLATVQEGLSAVRMVHAFGREQHEIGLFRQHAERSLTANLRLTTTTIVSSLVAGTLMALGTAAMYGIGARHVLAGELSIGDLVVFAYYLTMLYGPLESLTYTAWALEGAAAGAQRCFEVLDRENVVKDAPDAVPLELRDGPSVAFEGVAFGYAADQPILKAIDLRVEPGQTVAFVGGTGAGKSTLLSLVPRFYDPLSGTVRVGGMDVRRVTKKSLRDKVAIVLQDTLLFSTSVRENIAYSRPDATEEEIVLAAKQAQAHDFIMKMEGGYDSPVGERGSRLSVGQRQRLGIARAFLKNAPILLLDEPTSALDPTTERAIMDTLGVLMRGRTTLIITHRIATVHGVDRIAVIQDGTIAEVGTGPELLARGGAYAALFHAGRHGG